MPCEVCLDGINPKASLPRLSWVRAFVQVAACGSIAAAAEDMGVTGPTVSVALSALEKHLGFQLCDRKRRATQLTDAGRAVLPSLQQALWLLGLTTAR